MCPPPASGNANAHASRHQVVVIGGGIAGLTAVKVCQDHGIDAHAFERTEHVGGVWNHTYKNVRLQQHKDDFRLSGTEWHPGVKDFPDAKAVEAYIGKFVREHNLRGKVSVGVEVVAATRVEKTTDSRESRETNAHQPYSNDAEKTSTTKEKEKEWKIELSDGRVVRAEHLVVATGALGKPKIAADASAMFDDSFVGETLHSSEYYDAERFHGKDVLVVGGGSSAVEIAVDLARAADSTTMSIRGDPDWVFPRHGAFGESLRLCGGGDDAPLWVRNLRARATFRLKHGKLARYGMQPKGAPLNRRIVVSDEFYPLIAHGAIHVNRGGVKSVAGDVVTFQDGSKRRFDAVVLCTGYDVATSASAHPYLKEHLASVARNASEVDANLQFYLGCFLPDVERCSFVGGCFGFAAVPRIAELQAKAAVNVIMGVRPLPDAETQRRHIRRALAFHVQRGNTNVYTANAYYRELLEAAGEMRSAGAVHLGVKATGLGAVAGVLGLCAKAVHAACHRSRRIKNRLERQNVHVDLGPAAQALGASAAALFAAGSVLSRFGRAKGATPEVVSQMPPETGEKAVAAIAKHNATHHIHTSDSVLSMGSIGAESSASSRASSEGSSRASPGSPAIKMAEDTTSEGQKIAASRFKTPKEEVKDAYEKWADAYEHDSLEKLGFASPKVCVDTFLKFCPPQGKDVLDIGAGTGVLANMICQRGIKARRFDAMDLSPGMLKHLVKKGIYDKVETHDMSKYPWPFPSNKYDGSMCNGVLIYVDDPNCLDEFVRVMKPGGICVIMFRHDGYPDYEAKDLSLRRLGKWELVHKTPDQRNFNNMEFGENNEEDVIFNQWVFRVLENSADVEL